MNLLKKLALVGVLLAPVLFAQPAEAGAYCREYQKSISVGGRIQHGYGTACQQPDGAWMITSTRGNVDPFDDLYRNRDVILVSDSRPVYFAYSKNFRPVTYYPRYSYYSNSGPNVFFAYSDDDYHGWNKKKKYNQKKNKKNGHDWDDDDHGRGHGHGHGNGHDRH